MRKSSILLAGVVAALAGATAVVAAERAHVMTVLLPDGSVAHVRYTGDVAPRIVVQPVGALMSRFDAAFGGDSPFAAMERISAAMDAQAAAMMRQASALAAQPGSSARMTALGDAPAGADYSYVSSTTVNGKTCTTSVESVSDGAGKAPRMLRRVSGDCATAMQRPTGPAPAAPAAPKAPVVPADSI